MKERIGIKSGNIKPLKRKDKVQKKLRELTESLEPEKCGDGRAGFDASFIGGLIGVSRNNTSKELNRLVREGRAIKIEGKPVLYLDKYVLESKWGLKLDGTIIKKEQTFRKTFHSIDDYHRTDNKNKEVFKFKEIVGMHKSENRSTCSWPQEKFNINNMDSNSLADKSVLDQMIGAQESLKSQVEQAKAAVLYPPSGLHTLIVGPTGVGKTTFAEAMYRYAVEVKRLPPAAPFAAISERNF